MQNKQYRIQFSLMAQRPVVQPKQRSRNSQISQSSQNSPISQNSRKKTKLTEKAFLPPRPTPIHKLSEVYGMEYLHWPA